MFRCKKKQGASLKGLVILLGFAVLLLGTLPALAQEESLKKKLEEAEATIADQTKIIKELRDNFFKTVGELSEEIEKLRGIIDQQKVTIRELKKEEVVAPPVGVEELQARIEKLQSQLGEKRKLGERLSKKVSLLSQEVANLVSRKAELEAALTGKEKSIGQLTQEHKKEIQKLNEEISALQKKNTELKRKVRELTDDYFRVTEKLNTEIKKLNEKIKDFKAKNEEQKKTIQQITDNYFEVTGKLNAQIEELKAKNEAQES